jgi:hypothetical protein
LLAHTAAARVVLVFPRRSKLNTLLDFDRVRRTARELGCELAVVSTSLTTNSAASEAGIPSFFSLARAKAGGWRPSDDFSDVRRVQPPRRFVANPLKRFFPRPNWLGAGVGLVVTVVALSALAGLTFVWAPTATIKLASASRSITTIVPVSLDTRATSLDVAGRVVPATRIESTIGGTLALPSTGKADEFTGGSSGVIKFFSISPQDYKVPRGTVVSTRGSSTVARFSTVAEVAVPAGGSASVGIVSVDDGTSAAAGPNQINQVEGASSLYVTAINSEGVRGAGSRKVDIVTADDYRRVRAQLLSSLTKRAAETLGNEPAIKRDGLYVVPASVTIRDVQNEAYAQFVGEKSSAVTLTLNLQVSALAVAPANLNTVARSALLRKVPAGFTLADYEVDRGDEAEEGTGNRSEFFITARGRAVADIDTEEVKRLVRGRTPAEAQSALLNKYLLQRNPVISTGPDWIKPYFGRLPLTPVRIEATVEDLAP